MAARPQRPGHNGLGMTAWPWRPEPALARRGVSQDDAAPMAAPLPAGSAAAGRRPWSAPPRAPLPTPLPAPLLAQLLGLALGLVLLLAPAGAALRAAPAGPGGAPPDSYACAPIDAAGVAALFDRWNAALASGDPEQVAALYGRDALLLPTLSPVPRTDHAAIADYFVGFLAQGPKGRIDSRTVRLGCNEALDAGTYSFLLQPPGQPPRRVAARYSFVYAFDGKDWRIQHHHSSLMPAEA